ncbi:hypothetical protein WJX73_009307 [Symbiochloris irregularis]|uniref:BolA-like protein n=1 Tax=Symbiochloris irregularis TaxID=706552 RepID=A0AAW1Q1L6_9CHLO
MSSACLYLLQQQVAQRQPLTGQECGCSSRQIVRPAVAQLAHRQQSTHCPRLASARAHRADWKVNSIPVTGPDTYGDGRHVSIDVVADSFEGLSSVKRQRLVYKAIWLQLQDTVHAVDAMTTKTPQEAGL